MRGSLGFSILIAIGLIFGASASTAAQDARQLLAGIWSLNRAHSVDADSLERDAIESLPRPPGARGVILGRTSPRPIGIAGGFGPPRGFDPELVREAVNEASNAAQRVVLTFKAADTLLLGRDHDAPYVLVVNGKRSKRSWIDGTQVDIKASWKNRGLRIERRLENDLEITQTFALDQKSGRLIVTTEVDGPIPREIEVEHVYDRASATPP